MPKALTVSFSAILICLFILGTSCTESKKKAKMMPRKNSIVASLKKITANKDNTELIALNFKEIILPSIPDSFPNLKSFVSKFAINPEPIDELKKILLMIALSKLISEYGSIDSTQQYEIDKKDSSYIFFAIVIKNWYPEHYKNLLLSKKISELKNKCCKILESEINTRILAISDERLEFPSEAEKLKTELGVLLELIPTTKSPMDDINYIFNKALEQNVNDLNLREFVNLLKGVFPGFNWKSVANE